MYEDAEHDSYHDSDTTQVGMLGVRVKSITGAWSMSRIL